MVWGTLMPYYRHWLTDNRILQGLAEARFADPGLT